MKKKKLKYASEAELILALVKTCSTFIDHGDYWEFRSAFKIKNKEVVNLFRKWLSHKEGQKNK